MRTLRTIQFLAVLLALATAAAVAAQTAPTVYRDDNIIVRAGIVEAGTAAIHIGDALTLSIDVLFDPDGVRIENLDDEWLQQAFSATPQIRQYRTSTVKTKTRPNGQVGISGEWQLQVLDCPPQVTSCPGPGTYELPVIALSYQLADADGRFSSDLRSIRFQPWPGSIDVAAAIRGGPQTDVTIFDVLPGGAYPAPLGIAEASSRSTVMMLAGIVLFVGGLALARRAEAPALAFAESTAPSSRWEHALYRLFDDTLDDDQWSDMLRRSFAWYCTDRLHLNPYSWLGAAAIDRKSVGATEAPLREFFIEILSQAAIGADRRPRFRERLLSLTGHAGYADKTDQVS
ncbi:MAG: hypothetical protein HKN77_04485 [Woeseiaceae bacterium]|nr:hypothetical protein [Woeseiaceae bacterium]